MSNISPQEHMGPVGVVDEELDLGSFGIRHNTSGRRYGPAVAQSARLEGEGPDVVQAPAVEPEGEFAAKLVARELLPSDEVVKRGLRVNWRYAFGQPDVPHRG